MDRPRGHGRFGVAHAIDAGPPDGYPSAVHDDDPHGPYRPQPALVDDRPVGEVPPPLGPVRPVRSPLRRLLGLLAAAGIAVAKFGGLLLKGKFLISFLISAVVYTVFFGWQFGVGLVLLLLVHEMGHVIELRRQGVPASAPMFIPFMGAMVSMRAMPRNAWAEAQVGLAGPLLGSVAAAGVLIWADQVNSDLLRALAYVGFLLNLFNLVPVVPLDGGRAVAALHPAFWFVGLFMVAALAFHYQAPFFFVVLLFVAWELYARWSRRDLPANRAYHAVTWPQRVAVGVVYLGLVVALVAGMHAAHVPGIRLN